MRDLMSTLVELWISSPLLELDVRASIQGLMLHHGASVIDRVRGMLGRALPGTRKQGLSAHQQDVFFRF